MADMASGLMKLLEKEALLGIAFYSTSDEKLEFIERTKILAEPKVVRLVQSAVDALGALRDDVVVLIDATDELDAVAVLDHNREQILTAGRPVLLFLARGGVGERALAKAPALVSVVRDMNFDLAPKTTQEAAATIFNERHGMSHNDWLYQWRAGALSDTSDNNVTLSEALAIGDTQ